MWEQRTRGEVIGGKRVRRQWRLHDEADLCPGFLIKESTMKLALLQVIVLDACVPDVWLWRSLTFSLSASACRTSLGVPTAGKTTECR